MAQLTLTVPDAYVSTIIAAIKHKYGDAVKGLNSSNAAKYALKSHLRDLVKKHQFLTATSIERSAADQAVINLQVAEVAAKVALATAQSDTLTKVDDDFTLVN